MPTGGLEHAAAPVPEAAAEVANPFSLLDQLIATIDREEDAGGSVDAGVDSTPGALRGEGQEQHIVFALAGTEYAAPIGNVIEIGEPLHVTRVPHVPDWVLGVANLRGDIISIVDLRAFLGIEPGSSAQDRTMVVARSRGGELITGLMVDRVSSVRYLDTALTHEPAAPIDDKVAPYLRGFYEADGRLLAVLDVDQLLLSPSMLSGRDETFHSADEPREAAGPGEVERAQSRKGEQHA